MRFSRAPRRRIVCAVVVAPWVLWALVRAAGADVVHPLVAFMSFTPYAAVLSLGAVVVALALREWLLACAAIAAAAVLIAIVLPRALEGPGMASADARGTPLVVMSLNLYNGLADAREVMRLVREHDVDVLSLLELTPEALAALDAAGARTLLPARVVQPRPHAEGAGLLARMPLREVPAEEVVRPQPEARLRAGGRELLVKAVHPTTPISFGRVATWRRTLRALPGPQLRGLPHLLAGDFNATLDHRELRRLLDRGYRDAADATGSGLRPTWPAVRRAPPIAIDHILMPPQIEIRRLTVHDIPRGDHRALIAELLLADAR